MATMEALGEPSVRDLIVEGFGRLSIQDPAMDSFRFLDLPCEMRNKVY
jgi:hypothetical protein